MAAALLAYSVADSSRAQLRRRRSGCGDDAKLLHQPECVRDDPALGYLAVCEPVNVHAATVTFFPVGGMPRNGPWWVPCQMDRLQNSVFVCDLFQSST